MAPIPKTSIIFIAIQYLFGLKQDYLLLMQCIAIYSVLYIEIGYCLWININMNNNLVIYSSNDALIDLYMHIQSSCVTTTDSKKTQSLFGESPKKSSGFVHQTGHSDCCGKQVKLRSKTEQTKLELCNPNTDKNSQSVDDNCQIKIFSKAPSYFLQVQEHSVILQQSPSHQDSINLLNAKNTEIQSSLLESSQKKKAQLLLKKKSKLQFSGRIFYIKKQGFKELEAQITGNILNLGELKVPIEEITKLKCLSQTISPLLPERTIKIVKNQNIQYFIAALSELSKQQKCNTSICDFCEHFSWFSKIISNKIEGMKSQLKFAKYQQICQIFQQNNKPRISNQTMMYKEKLKQLGLSIGASQFVCHGTIFKKSKYLKAWRKRYIVITDKQLYSYRDTNEHYTINIKSQSVKYIWTRFDLYNGYLIIKLKHGIIQTQFAIPIVNYSQRSQDNWLWAFYRLMVSSKEVPSSL